MSLNRERVNLEAICRICLKNEAFLSNLFQTEAPNMLRFCGFLEVDEFDDLPDKICASCNDNVIQSYELKQLCISSKLYLQSLLETPDNLEIDTVDCTAEPEFNVKLENELNRLKNGISNSEELLYECSECGDQNVSKEHSCNGLCNERQNMLLKNDCDTTYDYEEAQQPSSESHNDVNISHEQKNDIEYQCPQCKVAFEHKQDVFVHQSIHGGDEFICNFCKKTFKTMKILKRHLKTHMITKSHICKICNKGFSEASDVVKHERRLHLGIPREKNYECKDCGQRFTDHYYLKVHQRKHTGEKPLECDICDRSFYDPRSLRVHMDAHKGIKPYLCNYCGKSFVQNAHLRQHIIVHTTEKPHVCTICSKRFTQSTSLQRHKKVHMVTHKCDICSTGFSRIHQLYRHKEEEHNIRRKRERKRTSCKNILK